MPEPVPSADDTPPVAADPTAPPAEPNLADQPLRSVHTSSLAALLEQLGVSLLVTTYQAGKLVIVRANGGTVNTHFRTFHSPMGLALLGGRLAMGTKTQVWEFHNQPAAAGKLQPPGKHDACFMPRSTHTTGDIRVHEMAFATADPGPGFAPQPPGVPAPTRAAPELWVVNTRFSCLCTLDRDHSFVPRWRPPFVSALAAEDRCHLNGMGLVDGRPRYATALGRSDAAGGWRAAKRDGGVLLDLPTGEVVAGGLSMPHSPRWHGGKLWVLESGRGSLSVVDVKTGKLSDVARVPGFTRGLDFVGPYAFVGLSQVRETNIFSGIPIVDELTDRACGVWAVDTRTGKHVGFLRFEAGVRELFAVQAVPGVRYPDLLTEGPDAAGIIGNSFVLPDAALAEAVVPG